MPTFPKRISGLMGGGFVEEVEKALTGCEQMLAATPPPLAANPLPFSLLSPVSSTSTNTVERTETLKNDRDLQHDNFVNTRRAVSAYTRKTSRRYCYGNYNWEDEDENLKPYIKGTVSNLYTRTNERGLSAKYERLPPHTRFLLRNGRKIAMPMVSVYPGAVIEKDGYLHEISYDQLSKTYKRDGVERKALEATKRPGDYGWFGFFSKEELRRAGITEKHINNYSINKKSNILDIVGEKGSSCDVDNFTFKPRIAPVSKAIVTATGHPKNEIMYSYLKRSSHCTDNSVEINNRSKSTSALEKSYNHSQLTATTPKTNVNSISEINNKDRELNIFDITTNNNKSFFSNSNGKGRSVSNICTKSRIISEYLVNSHPENSSKTVEDRLLSKGEEYRLSRKHAISGIVARDVALSASISHPSSRSGADSPSVQRQKDRERHEEGRKILIIRKSGIMRGRTTKIDDIMNLTCNNNYSHKNLRSKSEGNFNPERKKKQVSFLCRKEGNQNIETFRDRRSLSTYSRPQEQRSVSVANIVRPQRNKNKQTNISLSPTNHSQSPKEENPQKRSISPKPQDTFVTRMSTNAYYSENNKTFTRIQDNNNKNNKTLEDGSPPNRNQNMFRPTITESGRRSPGSNVTDVLKATLKRRKREKLYQSIRETNNEEELKECTFSPRLLTGHGTSTSVGPGEPFHPVPGLLRYLELMQMRDEKKNIKTKTRTRVPNIGLLDSLVVNRRRLECSQVQRGLELTTGDAAQLSGCDVDNDILESIRTSLAPLHLSALR